MTVFLPHEDGTVFQIERGKLKPRKSLAKLPPVFSKNRVMETARFLSSNDLGGRGFGTKGLDRTADTWSALPPDIERQDFISSEPSDHKNNF